MRFPGSVILLAAFFVGGAAHAFEVVNDEELSGAVGQAGISLGITQPAAGIVASEIIFNDANNSLLSAGIPASVVSGYDNAGNLVIRGLGIQACAAGAGCASLGTNEAYTVNIDATGDVDTAQLNNQPAVSIALAWASSVAKLRVLFNKLSLRNAEDGAGNRYGAVASNSDFLQLVNGYFDLTPAAGTPTMSVLLANEPLAGGNMITLANTNFTLVDFGVVRLLDNSASQNLNFSFRLDNLNLSGATINLSGSGLVMTMPQLSNLNVMLRNITVGSAAASMGSLGVQGLNVSGLTLTVTGKSS